MDGGGESHSTFCDGIGVGDVKVQQRVSDLDGDVLHPFFQHCLQLGGGGCGGGDGGREDDPV